MEIQTKAQAAQAIGDHAAYLLANECGLPRDAKLDKAVEGLRKEVQALVEGEILAVEELRFLIAQAIDIVPVSDLGAAATQAGFDVAASARIKEAGARLVKAMQAS